MTADRELSWTDGLLESGFGDSTMAAVMSWEARISRMIEVEVALAKASADVGIVPDEAARAIEEGCRTIVVGELAGAIASAHAPTPVIPLVAALKEATSAVGRAWLHHGTTSQDIMDTAAALQSRDALDHLEARIRALADRCAEIARDSRAIVIAGRTQGQQATPITFGLKAARWLLALDRRLEQLAWLRPRLLTVQLGGVAGTRAVYGADADALTQRLAHRLGLAVPELPWHAERDRVIELAGALAAVASTAGSIATDIVWLSQTEVAEASESGDGREASSALPYKRNPSNAVAARAASRLALSEACGVIQTSGEHEHERSAGAWQTEWVAIPSLFVRTGGAIRRLADSLDGLQIDSAQANHNLNAHLGLAWTESVAAALVPAYGRPRAQQIGVELAAAAVASGRPLRDIAAETEAVTSILSSSEIAALFSTEKTVEQTGTLIDRALARHAEQT